MTVLGGNALPINRLGQLPKNIKSAGMIHVAISPLSHREAFGNEEQIFTLVIRIPGGAANFNPAGTKVVGNTFTARSTKLFNTYCYRSDGVAGLLLSTHVRWPLVLRPPSRWDPLGA